MLSEQRRIFGAKIGAVEAVLKNFNLTFDKKLKSNYNPPPRGDSNVIK